MEKSDSKQLTIAQTGPSEWLGNALRITSIRIFVQAATFGLFLSFVLLTTFANLDRLPGLRDWVSKLLEVDPLISLATALATHTVYRGLLWSLVVLVPTLFLGRFFCGWICPYGTLHHFVGWAFRRRPDANPNTYSRAHQLKYYILTAMLAAALCGTLQIGLLDPISLVYRSLTGAMLPAAQMPAPALFGDYRLHQGAWLIGFILFGLLAANLVWPRFFCRLLCPLGALLGLLSRFAWWRIERDPDHCGDCTGCARHCEGACEPQSRLRLSECLLCFNCIEDCPRGALRFALFPPRAHAVPGPDVEQRRFVLAGLAGLLFYPFVRITGRATRDFSSALVRPPGAVEELEFLKRCIKCDQCVRVCPTNTVQPAWTEAGLEGLWTPALNFRIGHCQLHCTACGQVCPTGAIERISVARKLGRGEFADAGPVRIGTAHIDLGRCLPHSAGIECRVCEEVCPTSPKAIRAEGGGRRMRRGRRWREADAAPDVRGPMVDIDLCIGCGICERACPVVGDRRGIYVSAEGESRSRNHSDPDRNRGVRLGG